jgi:hypothetical protein
LSATSPTLALVDPAKALLKPLRDADQMLADRLAIVCEVSGVLDTIGHDLAGMLKLPGGPDQGVPRPSTRARRRPRPEPGPIRGLWSNPA